MSKLQPLNQPATLLKLAYNASFKSILSNEMRPDEIYNKMMLEQNNAVLKRI